MLLIGEVVACFFERFAILATIDSSGGNKTEAARRLGVTARTLSNKMKLWRKLGFVA